MSIPRYDVLAIGNAIVDVMSSCQHELIDELGLPRGGMLLIDSQRARELYDAMGPAREISGGSAANTLAGLSALGAQCAFVGQVADDQLGEVFGHDIRAVGIDFDTTPLSAPLTTARSLIFVTPDGQRTMSTFLGATRFLPEEAIDEETIRDAGILFCEGYLWDADEPRAAIRRAIAIARGAGRKIAFTLSDAFVIERHGDDFRAMIEAGQIDILFANHVELAALTGEDTLEEGVAVLAPLVPLLVVTRSGKGALAVSGGERVDIPAEPVARVVDTTGAGDLFAAGFLFGQVRGQDLRTSLVMGAVCAAEVISHYGARPEADIARLVAERAGRI